MLILISNVLWTIIRLYNVACNNSVTCIETQNKVKHIDNNEKDFKLVIRDASYQNDFHHVLNQTSRICRLPTIELQKIMCSVHFVLIVWSGLCRYRCEMLTVWDKKIPAQYIQSGFSCVASQFTWLPGPKFVIFIFKYPLNSVIIKLTIFC